MYSTKDLFKVFKTLAGDVEWTSKNGENFSSEHVTRILKSTPKTIT